MESACVYTYTHTHSNSIHFTVLQQSPRSTRLYRAWPAAEEGLRKATPKWGDMLPSKSQMAQKPTKIFQFS